VHQEKVIGCGGEAQRWIGPQLFAGGRAAMLEMGSWGLNDVGNGAKFKWDVGGMWGKVGGPTTHVSVDCNEVWNGSKNKDEAWTLIKELTSVESETMMIQEKGTQPSRMSVLKTWTDQLKTALPAFANINLKAFGDAMTGGFGDQEEMFTQDAVAKNTILGPIMDRILLLNTAPAADIVKYAQLANRFLAGEIKVENVGAEIDKLK
jgi:ABC-type glycerol-3-phosphate transport system substrate-binding protein